MPELILEVDGPVALPTLNRPERRNVLALNWMLELTARACSHLITAIPSIPQPVQGLATVWQAHS